MKNKFLMLMLGLLISFGASFAGTGVEVNERVINNFKKEFASARDVQWEQNSNYVKATFNLNEQVLFAYYSHEGSLIALSRNITTAQLPIYLQNDLRKSYQQYWITDLFEISMNQETGYYVTLENGDHRIVLKSAGSSGWEVYKKDRKQD